MLPGCFLERRLEVFAAERLLLLAVIFDVFPEFVGCEFVLCGPFLLVLDWFISDLLVPERTDTTVPTAVPTFCATSVKTPGSAAFDSLFESPLSFIGIRYPPQLRNFDASSANEVAISPSWRQIDVFNPEMTAQFNQKTLA